MNTSKEISCLDLESTWGRIRVTAQNGLIVSCKLPILKAEPARKLLFKDERIRSASGADHQALRQAGRFIRAVFAGRSNPIPPYVWPASSPFTARVWKHLVGLNMGTVITYGALARKIGRPGGARAVGRACGANPLPLFIPCHRVLPCDGSLGGFSSGLPWKRYLLDVERTRPAET